MNGYGFGYVKLMNNFSGQLLKFFRSSKVALLHGSSLRDPSSSVNATLAVFNGELIHIESGEKLSIDNNYLVNEIAVASRKLLESSTSKPSIQLLLPSSEFVATRHSLPKASKVDLTSALQLQVEDIYPSLDKKLAVAFGVSAIASNPETVAVWMKQELLDNLFDAYKNQGLLLACVKPRLLNLKAVENKIGFLEKDDIGQTLVIFERDVVDSWQQINKADLDQKEILEEWTEIVANYNRDAILEISDSGQLANLLSESVNREYSYVPEGARNIRQKLEKGRKVIFAGCFAALLLFLFSIPFAKQSIEFRRAAASLELNRSLSLNAREDRRTVINFDNQWGLLNDFPSQSINEVLFTLQNVISPERISSIEIIEGLIKLQGSSSEPQAILQKLEQDPLFTEVAFSRATSNGRYYIDLRLSPVNFEAYMIRYFPDN
ncbi:MAG: hypothetical protein P8K27_06705 [Gammaproteobacteria bacterium]|nr:hypothetical protein [Gammaproteobacteria bacterium]